MQFGKDVDSFLLFVVPIIMKINIHVIEIDTSAEAQKYEEMPKFSVLEGHAKDKNLVH